jgi:beta-galactosidase
LAGFPKDRFYLYQAYWRQDLRMAHILPHWTWPERVAQVTPVHVYTSGDEAELFINGESQGRQQKGQYEYRLRWDNATYQPGEVRVVADKNGQEWAAETVETAGEAAALARSPDQATITGDGRDVSFIKPTVVDSEGRMVPRASNLIRFSVTGPGEIVATDNGDPMDRNVFSSPERNAFSGLALAIVRAQPNQSGVITVTATSQGLTQAETAITAQ